jgi:hypothetical protein
MKGLTASVATTILLAGIGASDAAVRIVADPGGRIGAYIDRYQGMRSSGEMVIIDGYCASACTIVLGTVAHDKICVTSRARLGFHAAWDSGSNGRKITNPEATQALYFMYPFEVRRWISRRLGFRLQRTAGGQLLQGKTLSDFIKPFVERVKSGVKAFIVQVKYVANYDEAKKPVVTLQVAKNLLGRTADEGKESQGGTHLNHLPMGVAFELLCMSASSPTGLSQVLRPSRRQDYFKCRQVLALICSLGRRSVISNSTFAKFNLNIADAPRSLASRQTKSCCLRATMTR